jgi:hypothetical protein
MLLDDVKRIKGPDDPDRCNGVTSLGQCQQVALPGTHLCAMHGGKQVANKAAKESLSNYKLTQFKATLQEKSGSVSIKSLRDEIAILRLLIEQRLNMCHTPADLMMASGQIGDLVIKVEKLVSSCHRIEDSMGQLLDKSTLVQFADRVVSIIAENITDALIIEKVSNSIVNALEGKAVEADYTVNTPSAAVTELLQDDPDEG